MPETDLDLLLRAARAGGDIALRYWQTDFAVETKVGGSPVSEADYAVDDFLRTTLTSARPGYAWLSEETEDDKSRLSSKTVFIVDPIDGTRAFIEGQRTWALSLAVVRCGRPIAAVIHLPVREKTYTAIAGMGAELNGAPILASGRKEPDGASILASRASLKPSQWPGGLPRLDRHWRPSLAYRFCLVAEGRFDAVLTLRSAWEWDIAAGTLIAAEAGAKTTDLGGRSLTFNNEPAAASGVLSAHPTLHAALSERL